jgi:hypothetical protein
MHRSFNGVGFPSVPLCLLWFKRRTDTPQRHRWRVLALFGLEFVVVLIVYGGLGLVDIAGLRQGVQWGCTW